MRNRAEVDHAFTHHSPRSDEEVEFYSAYRNQAKDLAFFLVEVLPETAERTIALRALHDAVMKANLACAIHGLKESKP